MRAQPDELRRGLRLSCKARRLFSTTDAHHPALLQRRPLRLRLGRQPPQLTIHICVVVVANQDNRVEEFLRRERSPVGAQVASAGETKEKQTAPEKSLLPRWPDSRFHWQRTDTLPAPERWQPSLRAAAGR